MLSASGRLRQSTDITKLPEWTERYLVAGVGRIMEPLIAGGRHRAQLERARATFTTKMSPIIVKPRWWRFNRWKTLYPD